MNPKQLESAVKRLVDGAARLQVRQEAMECFVRALIVETPPIHPLVWRALQTAQSDLQLRQDQARPDTPPELAAEALALLNVLRAACAPPPSAG